MSSGSYGTESRVSSLLLILLRTLVPQRLIEGPGVIEQLDILKDRRVGFDPGLKLPISHQFVFQRAEETLHLGIVMAVPRPAHAGSRSRRRRRAFVRAVVTRCCVSSHEFLPASGVLVRWASFTRSHLSRAYLPLYIFVQRFSY